jgi:hypothetical protein
MKAFLSYKHGDDISVISKILAEKNIEIYDSLKEIEYGNSLQLAIKSAVKECDLIVFVYTAINPYIAYEAGLAVASNTPIFAIILPGSEEPYFLYDSPCVHGSPNEEEKIKFSFELFYRSLEKKPSKNSKPKQQGKNLKSTDREPVLTQVVHNLIENIDYNLERSIFTFFENLFAAYGISVAKNPGTYLRDFPADFSIWSDALQNILGNPILIEIKRDISQATLQHLRVQITSSESLKVGNSWLVFYVNLRDVQNVELRNSPKILFIDLHDFTRRLKTSSFNDTIKQIRNEIIHNK